MLSARFRFQRPIRVLSGHDYLPVCLGPVGRKQCLRGVVAEPATHLPILTPSSYWDLSIPLQCQEKPYLQWETRVCWTSFPSEPQMFSQRVGFQITDHHAGFSGTQQLCSARTPFSLIHLEVSNRKFPFCSWAALVNFLDVATKILEKVTAAVLTHHD